MGMSKDQWGNFEDELVSERFLKKGGIMNVRESIFLRGRQEGIQEGIQEGMQKGIQEGIQEGKMEGLQEGRMEMVLNMLKKNAEISFISDVTGLSEGEIKKLKNGSM